MTDKASISRVPIFAAIALLVLAVVVILYVLFGHEKPTITVIGEDSSNLRAMEALKSSYEQEQGVSIRFQADDFDTAWEKANKDLEGEAGAYDIILQYNFSLSNYVRNKHVLTLDDLRRVTPTSPFARIEASLFRNAWREVGFYYRDPSDPSRGEQDVGYPFAANTMLLVYNKKLFNDGELQTRYLTKHGTKLAPPTTWREFRQQAEFFTDRSNKDTYGLCLQGKAGGWLYYEWCNFLFGSGGRVMDKTRGWEGTAETPLEFDSEKGRSATALYSSLVKYSAGDFYATDATVQREQMLKGNVAMCIMWSDYVFELERRSGDADLEFGYATIPGDVSMLAGGAFYINKDSANPTKAIQYVLHLMDVETQVALMKKGLCSACKTAYDNSDVKRIPYVPALRRSLERGVYMLEAGPDSVALEAALTKQLQRICRGEVDVSSGLKAAKEEAEKARRKIWSQLTSNR